MTTKGWKSSSDYNQTNTHKRNIIIEVVKMSFILSQISSNAPVNVAAIGLATETARSACSWLWRALVVSLEHLHCCFCSCHCYFVCCVVVKRVLELKRGQFVAPAPTEYQWARFVVWVWNSQNETSNALAACQMCAHLLAGCILSDRLGFGDWRPRQVVGVLVGFFVGFRNTHTYQWMLHSFSYLAHTNG